MHIHHVVCYGQFLLDNPFYMALVVAVGIGVKANANFSYFSHLCGYPIILFLYIGLENWEFL